MTESRVSSERGAVIIQVLLAFLVLTAFLMFVVDYGVKWVSRNQAQNSADAGALAGAVALAYDDYDDRSDTGPAKLSARQIALSNYVFGQAQRAGEHLPEPARRLLGPMDETLARQLRATLTARLNR